MIDVRDISVGNFQGNIFLVYEDKPTSNKIVEVLKSKSIWRKSGQIFYKTTEDLNYEILFCGTWKIWWIRKSRFNKCCSKGIKQAEKLKINDLENY